jgi:hypothetical protein
MTRRGILQDRQLHRLLPGFRRLRETAQKAGDGVKTGSLGGTDHGHRRA